MHLIKLLQGKLLVTANILELVDDMLSCELCELSDHCGDDCRTFFRTGLWLGLGP